MICGCIVFRPELPYKLGQFSSFYWGQLSHILDPFQAEVVACVQGLQVAIDLRHNQGPFGN